MVNIKLQIKIIEAKLVKLSEVTPINLIDGSIINMNKLMLEVELNILRNEI